MTDIATMRKMAESATDRYTDITSLDQINRREKGRFAQGYPGALTPNWWALRLRVLELLEKQQRNLGIEWSKDDLAKSEAALATALNDDDAKIKYERNGLTREQWLYKWNPDALDGIKLTPSQMTAMLRETLRRF
jgi:hypothetical protein